MGKPKESLPFGSSTLLGHTVELMLHCTWPVLVVGRDKEQELPPLPLEAEVVLDDAPGKGPLWAIATGMRRLQKGGDLSGSDAVFVTGCDAPFLTADAIAWLCAQLGDQQAVMPRVGDTLQPLCAIYRLDCLPVIEQLLKDGIDTPRTLAEKVPTRVLDEAALRSFDPELRFLRNLNTPEEYDAARRAAEA